MGFVYLNERYDRNRAVAHFTQSLLLDGNQPDLRAIVGKDPTVDDLRKFYPTGAEIPEEFQNPNADTLNPNLPRPPVPAVDLPEAPSAPVGPVPGGPSAAPGPPVPNASAPRPPTAAPATPKAPGQ